MDSIFRQSFSNWELLLIDDGSRDSSSALCDRLGAQDTRVRVWHKEMAVSAVPEIWGSVRLKESIFFYGQ